MKKLFSALAIMLSITICMNAQSSTTNNSQSTAEEAKEFCGHLGTFTTVAVAYVGGVAGGPAGGVIGTVVGIGVGEATTKACENWVDKNTNSSSSSTAATDPKK